MPPRDFMLLAILRIFPRRSLDLGFFGETDDDDGRFLARLLLLLVLLVFSDGDDFDGSELTDFLP